MGIENVQQGDVSSTSFQLGPSAQYCFGDVDATTIPYMGAGLFYRAISSKNVVNGRTFKTDDSGTSMALYSGLAVLLRAHLAITPEASIVLESLGGNSGTTFQIGIGLAGFLY